MVQQLVGQEAAETRERPRKKRQPRFKTPPLRQEGALEADLQTAAAAQDQTKSNRRG